MYIYKVRHWTDNDYMVVKIDEGSIYSLELSLADDEIVHQGSLADCEAFIRLTEGGYFD